MTIHPIIKMLAPHYLALLLALTGVTAAIARTGGANPPTTSNGSVSSGGPGSLAVVQQALTIEAHLQPNSDPSHRLTLFTPYTGGPTFADNKNVQCAEFVWATYSLSGYPLPVGGNALDYWDYYSSNPSYRFTPGLVGTAKPHFQPSQWQEIREQDGLPTPGDIVVWGGGLSASGYPYGGDPQDFQGTDGIGHVAIVVAMTAPFGSTPGRLVIAQANAPGEIVMPSPLVTLVGVTASPGTHLHRMTIDPNERVETWPGMYVLGYIHHNGSDFQGESTAPPTSNGARASPEAPTEMWGRDRQSRQTGQQTRFHLRVSPEMWTLRKEQSTMHQADPTPTPAPPTGSTATGNSFTDVYNFALSVKELMVKLGWVIFFIGISLAGIMRMISFGSVRKIEISNLAIVAAVIGLAIILGANGIASVLTTAFGGGSP